MRVDVVVVALVITFICMLLAAEKVWGENELQQTTTLVKIQDGSDRSSS